MISFLKPMLGVSLMAIVGVASFSSAASLSFESVFTDTMKQTFENVADRIGNLDTPQQQRIYERIELFKTTYTQYPAVIGMLEYIQYSSMMDSMTIPELAMNYDELSMFMELLEAADLEEILMSNDIMVTVFAPTNDALTEALDTLDISLLELKANIPLLRSILLTHVIDHAAYSDQVMIMDNDSMVSTMEGTKLMIQTQNTLMIDDAELIKTDIVASNGVIHIVDHILLPDMIRDMSDRSRTLADLAMMNGEATIFRDLVTEAGLTETLMDVNQDITIFVPTNQAFLTFLEENTMNLSDAKENDMLNDILMYHIIPGSVEAVNIAMMNDKSMVATLQGGSLTLHTAGTIMIDDAMLVETDMLANNGIMHTIDSVLIPSM